MAISRMNMERQMRNMGGIMGLEDQRQGYFLGKLVKKATRAVKKIVKSPIGKAALLGAGATAFVMVLSNMSNRRERTIIDIYNRLNQLSQAVSRLEGQNR